MRLFLLFFLFFFSCQAFDGDVDPVIREIQSLQTNNDKKEYLEEIFKEDQKFRQGQSSEILLRYGKASDQYQQFMQSMDSTDSLNLIKIEHYVEWYGHPKINEVGELAAQAPWTVIHHSRDIEDRLRHVELLHQAYKNKDIDGGAFSLFLERIYNLKFRQRFQSDRIYQEQKQIDTLIQLLNLKLYEN